MLDFKGLVGQHAVKDKLAGLVMRGAPGHAHLFTGAAGFGKRLFACAFAKALLCAGSKLREQLGFTDPGRLPCGDCLPCKLFHTGATGDYLYVEPTGQGQRPAIPVDDIRRIVDWFSTRPLYSPRKVCIIAQADHMTEQAQNALLKTLEEPPSYGVAILTASNPGMLLETVRSRCSVTFFTGYTDSDVENILKNSPEPPHESAITLLAQLSGGNPGYAFELAASETFLSTRDELIGLFCGFLDREPEAAYLLSAFLDKNREHYIQNAGILIHWLRDIWLCSLTGIHGGDPISGQDADIRLKRYSDHFRPENLLDCIGRLDESCSALAANAGFSLTFNAMLFKMDELLYAS